MSEPESASEPADAPIAPEVSSLTLEPQAGWALPDAAPQFAKFHAQPGQQPTEPFAPKPEPAARKYPRKRILLIATGSVVALALVAAGVVALIPGRSGNSIVTAVHCDPANLASCLIKAPAGADRLSGTDAWDQETTATADLYRADVVKDAPGIAADTPTLLTSDGLHSSIVHTDWNAVDGDNVDIVLLEFTSQKGARAWNATRTGEILAAYRGQAVTIPGDSTAEAHAATKADAQGNVNAAYSTVVGNLVLNVAYSSPKAFSAKDLQTWAGTELASLRTAPAAPADPADAAPGTEQIACGSGLGSCLMPLPSGGEHWTSPNDKNWIAASTLTPNQFVKLEWDSKADTQSQVLSNFTSDGVSGIAHQDWMIDGGNEQADLYLIQTITASGAQTLTGSNFGEPDWLSGQHGTSHTIPGEPGAQAWYTNKDSNGFIQFYFMENIGNVIVHGWLFFYGSFDSGTADRWAQTQLNRVSRTASTQPMGLFPLSAPSLPAPKQGACPASGDCLLPVPAGSTDTSTSSYGGVSLDDSAYASDYEADTSSDFTTWLDADGFKSAGHRSWTAANGAMADATLVKYADPAQAQAAAQLEYGLNAAKDRVCTDAAVPDSLCLAEPVSTTDPLQKETIRVLAWKGDYEVSISVMQSNAADVADAYIWAQQQLDLLPAN